MPRIDGDYARRHIAENGERFDVIVAGGGPAGIGAAVGAAMNGARVLLLEAKAFFGGVAQVSGWMPMNRLLLKGGFRGGALTKFVEKTYSFGPDASRPGKVSWVDGDGLHIHPDYLRLAVMELLEEHGVKYRLHSPVTGAIMEEDTITGVRCEGKYGAAAFHASVIIDATGDGDVAYYAGAKMRAGRESDGMFMPVTLGFVIGNVDEERFFGALEADSAALIRQIQDAEGEGNSVSIFYAFDRTTVPGVVSVNNGGQRGMGVVNAMDLTDLNASERTGLQVAVDFVKIARAKGIAGLENCCLVRTGQALGVRETRRIEGDYSLTLEDAQRDTQFPDVVALRYGNIDPGGLHEDADYRGTIVNGHQYPYRAMLPKGVEGLLVSGRCASLTHLGLTTCKSMGNMMEIGQAAGVAAAIAAREGVAPRGVDVRRVQECLRGMGVSLGGDKA